MFLQGSQLTLRKQFLADRGELGTQLIQQLIDDLT